MTGIELMVGFGFLGTEAILPTFVGGIGISVLLHDIRK